MCCCPQIIYVARDLKDVAVSYYHHHRLFFDYTGSCEDFNEALLAEIGKTWDLCFWNSPFTAPQSLRDFMCAINREKRHKNVSDVWISSLRINEKAEISVHIIHS